MVAQVFLDAEYEEQKKEMEARADLARKRRGEEEAQLRERRIRARQVAEEQDQISADPRIKLLIELVMQPFETLLVAAAAIDNTAARCVVCGGRWMRE